MPQILESLPAMYEPTPKRIRWTRQQCSTLAELGMITGRYELIDGEIISKMGQKRPHAIVILLVNAWLIKICRIEFIQSQLPIEVPGEDNTYNEPEPDILVMKKAFTELEHETPGAEDVLLAIEVSDSSLRFDRTHKAALYARAGIPEYWVIDINGRQIFVHRLPEPSGYAEIVSYGADQEVSTHIHPQGILVSSLLPKKSETF